MSDRDAFLRAIRANPDDDTARLVFADWLDERDDPLGQFIRVQLELEPIRHRIDNPRAVELHEREDEFLRRHRDEWVGVAVPFQNPADFGPVFRRGLPDYACLSLDTFLAHGEALFAACPTLREVALYGLANRCSELTLSPLLGKLDTLEIADWLTEDDAISLSVSPHLGRISRFKLWLGGEAHFLNEVAKQAGATWPRAIELVQVRGGMGCFTRHQAEQAREQDTAVDALATATNARCGRELVRVTRPFERLFSLNGRLNGRLCAGQLPDGRKVLASGSTHHWHLATFSDDGVCQGLDSRLNGVRYQFHTGPECWLELDAAFGEWVNDELGLEPGLVWVREFDEADVVVALWPYYIGRAIENPSPYQGEVVHTGDPELDWPSRGGVARGWLERREFVIHCGGFKCVVNWRGQVCVL